MSEYTLILRSLFHLPPQNTKPHYLTNFPHPFSPFNPWNHAECLFNSEFRQSIFAVVFLSRKGLRPGMYLCLSPLELFVAHSLSLQKQLQNWVCLTPDSWLWHSVEGKSHFVASLACLKIWEQASWLFFCWMQQVAYICEGSCYVTVFNTFVKASFSKTAEPCLLVKSGLLRIFQALKNTCCPRRS